MLLLVLMSQMDTTLSRLDVVNVTETQPSKEPSHATEQRLSLDGITAEHLPVLLISQRNLRGVAAIASSARHAIIDFLCCSLDIFKCMCFT